MQYVHYAAFILISATVLFFSFYSSYVDWQKNYPRFVFSKFLDCVMYSVPFLVLVYAHYIVTVYELQTVEILFVAVPFTVVSVFSLVLYTKQFIFFSNLTSPLNKKVFPLILFSICVGILMAWSTINYAIYIFFPSSFDIQPGSSFAGTVFEFVYYTFSVLVSYSGGSVEATGLLPKLAQMIEIMFSYCVIGVYLLELIGRLNKAD